MTEQPPNQRLDPHDDVLMDELRALAEADDPVPASVLAAARGSYTWRTIDAELAALVYDSVLDTERLTAVRSADTVRLLTFETDELAVELEVTVVAGSRRIRGELIPPGPGAIDLRHGGGLLELEADARGRFTAEAVEPGPISLRCRREDTNAVVATEWVTI